MSKPMKTLELGDTIYEIVDDATRKRVDVLEQQSSNMSTSIGNINVKESIEKINNDINGLNEKTGSTNTNITAIQNRMTEFSNLINNKVTNPTTGSIGQVLAIETLDENGKPLTYNAVDNFGKTAYQYAQNGGYVGTEEEFYRKLAIENPTKTEFEELKYDLGGYRFYHNPKILGKKIEQKIYTTNGDTYVLSSSDIGMELLQDNITYTANSVILLVSDNTIYMNDEGNYILSSSEDGILLLEDIETYYSAEIVFKNTYEAVIITNENEYSDNNSCYVLGESAVAQELIQSNPDIEYISIISNSDYYSNSNTVDTLLFDMISYKTVIDELSILYSKIEELEFNISKLQN